MRITQHKNTPHEKPEPKVEGGAKEEEENQEEAPPKVVLSVSGAIARVITLAHFLFTVNLSGQCFSFQGDQDFPASSVKAFHDKTPKPANEFRPINKNHAIQQPKK